MTSAEESSSVSEDEGVISLETRARFGETLQKIQRRDASIYDPNADAFFETDSTTGSEMEETQDEEGPLYLKDVRAQQLLEHGAAAYESSEEEEEEESVEHDQQRSAKRKRERFLYDQEQSKNRLEVMRAMEAEDVDADEDANAFGGLQKVEREEEIDESQSVTDSETEKRKQDVNKSLDSYFARVTDLEKEDVEFLREYIENEQWRIDKWGAVDSEEEAMELDQDEAYLERAAKFESDYNFRFEEPGSHEIVGHPRQLEGTLRKKESKRKRQRANKAERKRVAKEMEEQEIKQQKNQKRKEIQKKLAELNETCGGGVDQDLLQKLLDSDNEFDADEWDAKMEETFNEDYYKNDDAEFTLTTEERQLQSQSNSHAFDYEREEVDDAFEGSECEHRQELERLMQEYYRLDREDSIDGLKCRYRYIKVPKEDYGLAPHDVFCLDDKQLNSYVGLRRLNPYRDDQGQFNYNPGKLRKLLDGIDYSGKRSSSEATAGNQNENGIDHDYDDDESFLAQKIEQELNPNVKARLESYSHETLKPYPAKKRQPGQDSNSQKDTVKKEVLQEKAISEFDGMTKAQKKNAKRRVKKKEKTESIT